MASADQQAKWREAEGLNKRRLIFCALHTFEAIDSDRRNRKYRCTKCAGQVNAAAYFWYMQGIEHARKVTA